MVSGLRPLVGLTGLGLSVGIYLGAGGFVVVAGRSGAEGLTAGFGGMDLTGVLVSVGM